MEGANSADNDWDNLNVRFQGSVGLKCQSEWFAGVINMVDDCLYVAIGGVFAFDDLNLYLAIICEVFNEFALRVKGVPNRPGEVRFVVFGFILWV